MSKNCVKCLLLKLYWSTAITFIGDMIIGKILQPVAIAQKNHIFQYNPYWLQDFTKSPGAKSLTIQKDVLLYTIMMRGLLSCFTCEVGGYYNTNQYTTAAWHDRRLTENSQKEDIQQFKCKHWCSNILKFSIRPGHQEADSIQNNKHISKYTDT